MAKTLYEGYRVSKDGGGRWTGTIKREARSGRNVSETKPHVRTPPKGGSAFSAKNPSSSTKHK